MENEINKMEVNPGAIPPREVSIANQFAKKATAEDKQTLQNFKTEAEIKKFLLEARIEMGGTSIPLIRGTTEVEKVIKELRKNGTLESLEPVVSEEEKKRQEKLAQEKIAEEEKLLKEEQEKIREENKKKIEAEKAALRAELVEIARRNMLGGSETPQKSPVPVTPDIPLAKPLLEWQKLLQKKVKKPKVEKIPEPEPIREHLPIVVPKLKGLEVVDDEEINEIILTNEERENERALIKAEQDAVFDNEEEFNDLYNGALKLEKNREAETDAYYYEFLNLGEKYSVEKITTDVSSLREREEEFEQKNKESGHYEELEKYKKIANMAEIGIAYGVSEMGWYGEKVKVNATSKFDDIKRRIDEVMEIEDVGENAFLSLGIDITFQSLQGGDYKQKVFTLLESIRDGFKTKVKYAKNDKGEPIPEFVAPKVIVHIDIADVKKLAYLMKNIEDSEIKEKFKQSPQKFDVMNQVITTCERLAMFSRECKNDAMAAGYKKALGSLQKLAQSNTDMQAMFDSKHGGKTISRLRKLIKDFKVKEKREEAKKLKENKTNSSEVNVAA